MKTRRFAITAFACKQCEELGEYAMAEQFGDILVQEQDHQIALATALGVDVPDVTSPKERA